MYSLVISRRQQLLEALDLRRICSTFYVADLMVEMMGVDMGKVLRFSCCCFQFQRCDRATTGRCWWSRGRSRVKVWSNELCLVLTSKWAPGRRVLCWLPRSGHISSNGSIRQVKCLVCKKKLLSLYSLAEHIVAFVRICILLSTICLIVHVTKWFATVGT